ncbi:MAG: ankyrin repeat domain-containing protein [Gemmatimonadaceae bacterium]|nr:ankyrin repeat domain-containing protein [Gemmatimonadaceae bacterium]
MSPRFSTLAAACALLPLGLSVAHAQANAPNSDRARVTTTKVSSSRTNAGVALVAAAASGDAATVRAMMARGADVNVAQGDGMTAVHWAAERGDAALASALLKAGAKTDAKTRNGGYTPLHIASRAGAGAVVKALLAAGADAKTPTSTGASALHLAAASSGVDAVQALLNAKVDPNTRETSWGQTPLMFAASANRPDAVRALLKGGANAAIKTQSLDLSEELARQQAAARKRNEVLLAALPAEKRDSIQKAMSKSANDAAAQRAAFLGTAAPAPTTAGFRVGTAAPPTNSLTPAQIQEAIMAGRSVFEAKEAKVGAAEAGELLEGNVAGYEGTVGKLGGLTALLHAARQGNIDATMALIDGGANINEPSATDSSTPLVMALINGHYDLAMELVKRGANVKQGTVAGLTPLYAAINTFWAPRSRYPQPQSVQTQKTTHLELASAMIKAGADVNVRLKKNLWFFAFNNCGNANCGLEMLDGTTPFWRAAYSVDLEAMQLLKAAGADDTMPSFRVAQARGGRGGAAAGPGAAAVAAGPGRGAGGPDGPGGPAIGALDAATDSAAKAVPPGIGVYPIHSAAGVGYGNGFAGNSHRHAPDGWMPVLKYLVEELKHDVNKRDLNGYTPLHHAAARGDNEMILYLVSKGADVKAVARNGRTTVDMANGPVQRLRPFPETIALLEKLGAKNSHKCVSC